MVANENYFEFFQEDLCIAHFSVIPAMQKEKLFLFQEVSQRPEMIVSDRAIPFSPPTNPIPELDLSEQQIAGRQLDQRHPGIALHILNTWWVRQQGPFACKQAIQFFSPVPVPLTFPVPNRPLRALFLTSLRDVAVIERVGRQVCIDGRSTYMQGTIEAALRLSQPGGELHGYLDVAGVIVDDHEMDLFSTDMPRLPTTHQPWIHPLHLRNGNGECAEEFTYNIPSRFRELPLDDDRRRAQEKLAFEGRVADLFERLQADVIIVDHYMAQLEFLMQPSAFGLYGRILNTHPGITRTDSPWTCVGKDSEIRALEHAQGRHWDAERRQYVDVPPHFFTGATFHFVDSEIDRGLILCDSENTPVLPSDNPLSVIQRNYALSKNPVFSWGVRHYASHIFPHLDTIVANYPGTTHGR